MAHFTWMRTTPEVNLQYLFFNCKITSWLTFVRVIAQPLVGSLQWWRPCRSTEPWWLLWTFSLLNRLLNSSKFHGYVILHISVNLCDQISLNFDSPNSLHKDYQCTVKGTQGKVKLLSKLLTSFPVVYAPFYCILLTWRRCYTGQLATTIFCATPYRGKSIPV